jgi:large subunit ribosomal protein L5
MQTNDRHLEEETEVVHQEQAASKKEARSVPKQKANLKQEARPRTVPRLLQRYREQIASTLLKEFGYANPMEVPRLKKVVLNVGLGEALVNANSLETTTKQLAAISGQHPVTTKARKSIAAFKLREGNTIGVMVTLRSHRMYEFVDRLLNAALPRIRDFRGVPRTSFDNSGGYSLGIREQVIFPEIDYNQIDRVRGLQITFVTSAKNSKETFRLLELMGMPFAREDEFKAR